MTDGEQRTVSTKNIFFAFLRLGLTAFGGPAMVAYIRRLAVREKEWVSEDSFHRGIALCQTIPGATAMQAAAYAGLRAGGPMGAVAAYTAFGLPAFLLMVTLSAVYAETHNLPAAIALFTGLQAIVVALVANAALDFGRRYIRIRQDVFLVTGITLFLALGGSPIIAILCSALPGILLYRKQYPEPPDIAPERVNPMSRHGIRPALMVLLPLALCLGVSFFLRKDLFTLAILMAKVDFFAFGGGYASVPLLFHEIVEVHHWLGRQALMDGIALGQVTPGPIVITATFAGYLLAGIPGSFVGTVAIFTPSLFLLLLVVPWYDRLQQSVLIQRALRGILVSFVGLLLSVTIRFAQATCWTPLSILLGICAFAALWKKVNILWVVLIGAVISTLLL